MSCQQYEELFPLYLYGELPAAEEESVEAHCAVCASCAAALERERALHAAFDRTETPVPATLLVSCRRELSQTLAASAPPRPDWRARFHTWFGTAGWKPAVAMALVAIGFFGGRIGQRPGKDFPADTVMTRVREVNPDGQGGVRLVLEETRQRTLGGSMNDDRIKGLLLAAAQDPSDAGVRIGSVDLLRQRSSALDVRRALMTVLEHDPNPGVRLKALEGLRPYANEPEVRRLLAQSLERDDNPGIRTQAVDVLIEHGQKDMVDVLQRLMEREDNGYIRSRSRHVLEAMNASVETF
jgi:hypothetical protein